MALTNKLTAIADAIREKTKKEGSLTLDEMVTEINGIETGVSGESFELGGINAELVADYNETWSLDDTSFVKGSTAPSTATSIKAATSNKFTSPTIAIGDKDIIVVQTCEVDVTHNGGTNKALQNKYAYVHVTYLSKRKTSPVSSKTTRQSSSLTNTMLDYYNTSGAKTRTSASYGLYVTPSAASVSSATSANATIRVSSPVCYARYSTSYETSANMKLISGAKYTWGVKAYLVDPFTSPASIVNDYIDEIIS